MAAYMGASEAVELLLRGALKGGASPPALPAATAAAGRPPPTPPPPAAPGKVGGATLSAEDLSRRFELLVRLVCAYMRACLCGWRVVEVCSNEALHVQSCASYCVSPLPQKARPQHTHTSANTHLAAVCGTQVRVRLHPGTRPPGEPHPPGVFDSADESPPLDLDVLGLGGGGGGGDVAASGKDKKGGTAAAGGKKK
jgi:hypothetical protein